MRRRARRSRLRLLAVDDRDRLAAAAQHGVHACDSRIEVLPQSVWWTYYDASAGVEGWQATLDAWHVDVAVLARDQQSDLIPRMKADPGWELVYEDAEGLIFRRVSTPLPAAGSSVGVIPRSSR